MEEELHRNAAFVLRHAEEMPEVSMTEPVVRSAAGGLFYVDVEIHNARLIPTRTALAAANDVGLPDELAISGDNIEVLAGGNVTDRFRPERFTRQEKNPAVLQNNRGVPGRGRWQARWLVRGSGSIAITYRAEKARNLELTATLTAQ